MSVVSYKRQQAGSEPSPAPTAALGSLFPQTVTAKSACLGLGVDPVGPGSLALGQQETFLFSLSPTLLFTSSPSSSSSQHLLEEF